MTSDLDATTDDLYRIIRDLLLETPQGGTDEPATADASVTDTAIADASGLDLGAVRDFLDNADGVRLVVDRDGDTRTVTDLLSD